MDLSLRNKLFIVGGASSGLGKAIAFHLLSEGARVIGVARHPEKFDFPKELSKKLEIVGSDLTQPGSILKVLDVVDDRVLDGVVFNAGGPPAASALETTMEEWDDAYKSVLRWKVALTKAVLPDMLKNGHGRLLYIESRSVKQPIANLVLSNAMRAGVVGFVKTLSQEVSDSGVTLNVLAPGFHDTAAADRIVKKNANLQNRSIRQTKSAMIAKMPMKMMGDPYDFGALGAWLLSPFSRYINGQTISVDGGSIQGLFG